jgi:hypothetical protein
MYFVVWVPDALRELMALATAARDPDVIDRAAMRIDQKLATDPKGESESRDQDRRVLVEPPLVVFFSMDPARRAVIVLSVRHFT